MPPIPTTTDRFLVVPFQETPPETLDGAAQVYVVETNDADIAAQVAFDMGFPRCIVVLGTYYEQVAP
jgi:hypothetical protein